MALLARTTGVFGETAAGVTLGALRAAVAAGEVGRDDKVVLLVTGDGLKTPGPSRSRTPRSRSRPTQTRSSTARSRPGRPGRARAMAEAAPGDAGPGRRYRLARHNLVRRAPRDALVTVVERMTGAQAQLLSAAQISLSARIADLTVPDVEPCSRSASS